MKIWKRNIIDLQVAVWYYSKKERLQFDWFLACCIVDANKHVLNILPQKGFFFYWSFCYLYEHRVCCTLSKKIVLTSSLRGMSPIPSINDFTLTVTQKNIKTCTVVSFFFWSATQWSHSVMIYGVYKAVYGWPEITSDYGFLCRPIASSSPGCEQIFGVWLQGPSTGK